MREVGAADAKQGLVLEKMTQFAGRQLGVDERGALVAYNVHIRVFMAVAWNFFHGGFSRGLSLAFETADQHTRYGED